MSDDAVAELHWMPARKPHPWHLKRLAGIKQIEHKRSNSQAPALLRIWSCCPLQAQVVA